MFKNLELNFRLNQDKKVVEISLEIITKDINKQTLSQLKWQTITIDPETGKFTYENFIVLYDSVKGNLSLISENEKQNCIQFD